MFSKITFLIYLLIITTHASPITVLNEQISEYQAPAKDCLVSYVKSIITYQRVVIFVANDDDQDDFKQTIEFVGQYVMKSGKHSVLRQTYPVSHSCLPQPVTDTQYLILSSSYLQLHQVVHQSLCLQWSHRSQFIIMAPTTAEFDEMVQFIEEHMPVKNTLIITRFGEHVKIYFGKYRCSEDITLGEKNKETPAIIHSCTNDSVDNKRTIDGYTNTALADSIKKYYNYNEVPQCKMRFGVRSAPPYAYMNPWSNKNQLLGTELVIVQLLFGITDDDAYYGPRQVDSLGKFNIATGEGYGLLKHLYNRNVSLLMGALSFYESDYQVEVSYPMFYSVQQAIVIKQKNKNMFFMFGIFTWGVWMTVMFIAISLLSLCYVVKKRDSHARLNCSMLTLVVYFYAIMLSKDIPIRNNNLKLIFLSWILISFFLRLAIEAMMRIEMFVNRDKDSQVDSLAEICCNGYKIFVSEINYSNFRGGISVSDCFIPPQNFILVKSPLHNLTSSNTPNVAAFMYKLVFDFEKWPFTNKNDENSLPFHVIKERINNVPLVYFYNRGDKIGHKFRENAMILMQCGLVEYNELSPYFYMDLYNSIAKSPVKVPPISMDHVDFLFELYFSGCFLAMLLFLGEIVYHKCNMSGIRWRR